MQKLWCLCSVDQLHVALMDVLIWLILLWALTLDHAKGLRGLQVWGQHKLHTVAWLLTIWQTNYLLFPGLYLVGGILLCEVLEPRIAPTCHDFPWTKCECIGFNLLIPHSLASSVGGFCEPLGWYKNCGAKAKGHSTLCIISKPHLLDVGGNCFQFWIMS